MIMYRAFLAIKQPWGNSGGHRNSETTEQLKCLLAFHNFFLKFRLAILNNDDCYW